MISHVTLTVIHLSIKKAPDFNDESVLHLHITDTLAKNQF